MTHPVSFHDQVLKFIQTDSYSTKVDKDISFALLAKEFENYWRAVITCEVSESLLNFPNEEKQVFTKKDKQNLLRLIWGGN